MSKDLKLDEYEPVSPYAAAFVEGLIRVWEKLGKPEDLETNSGWLMMDQIVAVWHKLYPQEVADWKHDREIDLTIERTVKEHVQGGGYNPITYPPRLFQMIKAIFPNINLSSRKIQRDLTSRYPLFKTTNLSI